MYNLESYHNWIFKLFNVNVILNKFVLYQYFLISPSTGNHDNNIQDKDT